MGIQVGESAPSSSGLAKQTGSRHTLQVLGHLYTEMGQREAGSLETKWIFKVIITRLEPGRVNRDGGRAQCGLEFCSLGAKSCLPAWPHFPGRKGRPWIHHPTYTI